MHTSRTLRAEASQLWYVGSNLLGNDKEIVKAALFTAYGKVATSPRRPSPGAAIDGRIRST